MADLRSTRNDDARTEAEEILAEEEAAAAAARGETAEGEGADGKKKKNQLPEIPVAELAVVTSREDLVRVLVAHQKWVDAVFDPRVEVASGRANLQGADLRGYDLKGVNLSGANLSGANLQGVDLSRANLTVADLRGAQLQGANLGGAKLMRAKLDGADLTGADLTGAMLSGVDLSKATMRAEGESDDGVDRPVPAPAAPAREVEGASKADGYEDEPALDKDEGAEDAGLAAASAEDAPEAAPADLTTDGPEGDASVSDADLEPTAGEAPVSASNADETLSSPVADSDS